MARVDGDLGPRDLAGRVVQDRPNFDEPFGATTNPLRLVYMMGTVWFLAQRGLARLDVLEVGSWCGASALAWGEAIARHLSGGSITCVDPWQPYIDLGANPDALNHTMNELLATRDVYEVFRSNMTFLPACVALDVRRGDSKTVLPTLARESYDLIYIDGDHTYEVVRTDLANAAPLLRDGGILCGDDLEVQLHDCDPGRLESGTGLERLWDEQTASFLYPGVTRAVGEAFGPVSCWDGFWAMQKAGDCWRAVSLQGMPAHIPSYLPSASLMGLKAVLMKRGLL